jgi:hypothetical protein
MNQCTLPIRLLLVPPFCSCFDLTVCDREAWLKQLPTALPTALETGPECLPRFAWG